MENDNGMKELKKIKKYDLVAVYLNDIVRMIPHYYGYEISFSYKAMEHRNYLLILEHLGDGIFRELLTGKTIITEIDDERIEWETKNFEDKRYESLLRHKSTPLIIPISYKGASYSYSLTFKTKFYEVDENIKVEYGRDTLSNSQKVIKLIEDIYAEEEEKFNQEFNQIMMSIQYGAELEDKKWEEEKRRKEEEEKNPQIICDVDSFISTARTTPVLEHEKSAVLTKKY